MIVCKCEPAYTSRVSIWIHKAIIHRVQSTGVGTEGGGRGPLSGGRGKPPYSFLIINVSLTDYTIFCVLVYSRHGGSKKKVEGDFSSTFSLLPPYLLYYVGSCELYTSRKESGQRDYTNVLLHD